MFGLNIFNAVKGIIPARAGSYLVSVGFLIFMGKELYLASLVVAECWLAERNEAASGLERTVIY